MGPDRSSERTRKRKQNTANQQPLTVADDHKLVDTAGSSNSNELIENEETIFPHGKIEDTDATKIAEENTTRKKKKSIGRQDGSNNTKQECLVEEEQRLYEEAIIGCSHNMRKIVDNWKNHIPNEELEEKVFNLYIELKLNNISLLEEVELFIYEVVMNRCFLQKNLTTCVKIGDIKKHMKFLSNIVDIVSSFADDEEILIFSLQYLTKEIYLLKHLLRSTYDKLPWEEMEFYLLCFIISETQQHDLRACYKAILKKSELIKFLKIFSSILKKTQIDEAGELLKLPDLERNVAVHKIVENYPDFKALYDQFECIRDINSLYKISEYAKLIHSTHPQEKGAKEVIIMVLCMISQHFKSTLVSPKLSQITSNFKLLSVSDESRKTISKIINANSFREALNSKIELVGNSDETFLLTIRNDLNQIGEIADELLLRHYIRLFTRQFDGTAYRTIMEEIENTFPLVLFADKKFKTSSKCNTIPCNIDKLIDNFDNLKTVLSKDDPIRIQLENIIETKFIISKKETSKLKPVYACMMRPELENVFSQNVYLQLNINEIQDILSFMELIRNNAKKSNRYDIEKLCAETINLLMFEADIGIWNEKFSVANILQEFSIIRDKPEKYIKTMKFNYHDYLSQSLQELRNILQKSNNNYKKLKAENKTLELMKSLILDIILVIEILNSGNENDNVPKFNPMLIDYLESDCELNDLFFDSIMATFHIAKKFSEENPKDIILARSNECKNTFLDYFIMIAKKQRIFSKVAKGDLDIFSEDNAEIRARDFEKSTYLHIAVKMCNNQQISNLCDQGLSFHCRNIKLCTPLHIAVKDGNDEVVLHIVKKTKNVIDQVDDFGRTALHIAVLNEHNNIVQILIECGSNPFLKDHLGFTALIYAVICKNEVILRLFQLHKEKLNKYILERDDVQILFHSAIEMNLFEIVEFLLNKNLVKLDSETKAVAMCSTVYNGHLEILQILLRYDIDPNISIGEVTPLHIAVLNGQSHMIPVLRNAGANPFVKDDLGRSPFSYALSEGRKELLPPLLFDNRAESSKEEDFENLFHTAIKQNDIEVVEGLLSQKLVMPDAKSQTSAICSAISDGQVEILETLLRHGADPNNLMDGHAPIPTHCCTNKLRSNCRKVDCMEI